MLYRSSILRKESQIRQVSGKVGAVVDPLLTLIIITMFEPERDFQAGEPFSSEARFSSSKYLRPVEPLKTDY